MLRNKNEQLLNCNSIIINKLNDDAKSINEGGSPESAFLNRYIEFIGEEQQTDRHYFEAITLIHPALVEKVSSLPDPLQDTVRSGLLSAVLARQGNLKCMGALGLLLREVVEKDNEQGNFE